MNKKINFIQKKHFFKSDKRSQQNNFDNQT